MSTSRIESLPPELLTLVVDYIPRPTDLKNLCLACKVLRNIATPPLYKTAVFDDKTPGWPKTSFGSGFLTLSHPGLAHVRALNIESSITTKTDEQEQPFFKRALQVLPRHGLTTLAMPKIECTEDMIVLLCTQQSKLAKISIGSLMFDFNAALNSNAFGAHPWPNLQELIIPTQLGSVQDLHAYRQLIHRSNVFSALEIHVHRWMSGETIRTDDSQTRGTINSILFSHSESGEEATVLGLKKLTLNLSSRCEVSTHIFRLIDLGTLTSLRIDTMSQADRSLDVLASHFEKHGSSLSTFSYSNHYEMNKPLERFFNSFAGLKRCSLTGGYPNLESLHKHEASLSVLSLDTSYYGNKSVNGSIQKQIAANFRSLRVLSIDMPDMVLSATQEESSATWQDVLLALISMPQLQAFNIQDVPKAPEYFFSNHGRKQKLNAAGYMEMFSRWTERTLNDILSQATQIRERLPVLLFQSHWADLVVTDASEDQDLDIEPFSMLPAKRTDAFGRVSQALVRGSVSDACYMEPELPELWEIRITV